MASTATGSERACRQGCSEANAATAAAPMAAKARWAAGSAVVARAEAAEAEVPLARVAAAMDLAAVAASPCREGNRAAQRVAEMACTRLCARDASARNK